MIPVNPSPGEELAAVTCRGHEIYMVCLCQVMTGWQHVVVVVVSAVFFFKLSFFFIDCAQFGRLKVRAAPNRKQAGL